MPIRFNGNNITFGNVTLIRFNGNTVYEKATVQLDTPLNVSVSGTTANFSEVENATTYEFFIDGISIGKYTPNI